MSVLTKMLEDDDYDKKSAAVWAIKSKMTFWSIFRLKRAIKEKKICKNKNIINRKLIEYRKLGNICFPYRKNLLFPYRKNKKIQVLGVMSVCPGVDFKKSP
jgi:hypothetical protein